MERREEVVKLAAKVASERSELARLEESAEVAVAEARAVSRFQAYLKIWSG